MITTENFILEDLTYLPMGNHHPVYKRPYIVNATKQAVDTISERMYDTKSGKVTPTIIGDMTGNIIQPSAVPQASVINRDWVSTQRYIFVLKVKTFDMMGTEINSYIQGYTDYNGITNTGNIDGNMVHFINNVIETTEMVIQTPLGIIRKEKLYKIYNVFSAIESNDLFTQRPCDVLENINMLNMANIMDSQVGISSFSYNNMINPFNSNMVSSTVDNNITTEYLSKILTTGLLSNKSKEIHIGSYEVAEQDSINTRVPEPSINDNRFIRYISAMAGYKTVRDRFNFQQLMNIDNTIYNRFKVINLNKDFVNPMLAQTPEVGDYWEGQDPVTIKAYSLIENSVSMATKYGFNKLFFTASNMTNPTGVAEVFITNFGSFINLDEHDFNFLLEIFKEKFVTEIFLSETNSSAIPMHMEVYIDLLGTSKIQLSYAGYPSNWYTIPTTANSLFSPVITNDKETFDYVSHNLGTVIDTISSNENVNRSYY